ncbi:GntR family transcriptional regulator [Streptomyces sp. NPDC051172]|uniref:GntR family transcriptional regulator n=1 Tax=Streptomyces sp. NPDC051172 TaxID=3155796 RepID=UPI003413EECA
MTSGGHYAPRILISPGRRGRPGQRTAAGTVPQWRHHLKQLPAYDPGAHLTAHDRELYRAAVAKARDAGGTLQGIAAFLGRSYSFVRTLLDEAGMLTTLGADNNVEATLRAQVADGTYRVDDVLPPRAELCAEFGVTRGAVDRAIGRLAAQGIMLSVEGRGTVVIDPEAPPTGPLLRVRMPSGQWESWTVRAQPSVQRIRDAVIDRVLDGTYPEGTEIPGSRQLAEEFGVIHPTVDRALAPLKQSGLLITRQASGTFVHRKARSRLQSARTPPPGAMAQAASPGMAVWEQAPGPDRAPVSRTIHHPQGGMHDRHPGREADHARARGPREGR